MKKLMLAVSVMMSLNVEAKPKVDKVSEDNVFYVYQDKGSKKNHFIPSGWMGSTRGMKLDDAWKSDCLDGLTCIKLTYDPKNSQDGWHGLFWQATPNNWGNKTGGYNLKGYKRLTFWARADQENVTINEFKVGGIKGEVSIDTDDVSIGPITLAQDWKKYEIDLTDKNLEHINGGFCYATADNVIPEKGMTMFLDEIRYEK